MFWQFGNNNVNFTTCFDTLATIMSISRRVLTYLRNKCRFYDVFLMVRTLKYGTVARFFRKCTKNVDETRPEPSGTLRAKYAIYWWKKHQFYDVFLHIYEKRGKCYSVCWHIGKQSRQCYDVFWHVFGKIRFLRRVFEGQNTELLYRCTIFFFGKVRKT